jgi:hypothetical protein
MNKVDRIINFLTGEVGMRPDETLSRIPSSVIFTWITLFAQKNSYLRVTRTWFDPADEDGTLIGICDDCLSKKESHITAHEENYELAMCAYCNPLPDYDRLVDVGSYGREMIHPVRPIEISRRIDTQWKSGNGFIDEIYESDEWRAMQEIKSAARKDFCVLVDEEYGYKTHLWWPAPNLLDAQEVLAWYKQQGWIHMHDLHDWGKVLTVENTYEDLLDRMGLPKLHVHEEDDQYFQIPE